ncbi:MAG TPA: MBOAT family O-acyltransferase [Candidatus Saccharimonadaceae bacterium]|nr:MBOAT family O-acyltransferase [Candidatus Saccharimonadaceae bacterium]
MIFSSIEFFVFLAVVLGLLAALPGENARRNLLVGASYVFYGWWDWRFCLLLLGYTVLDYNVGVHLEDETRPGRRRAWLIASLVGNLGTLAVFKYTNFFLSTLAPLLDTLGVHVPKLHIVLPVGISFMTFQTMSYSIDVYQRRLRATRNFRDFAMFAAFFPQLVAGPIVRGSVFLPQLERVHPPRLENLRLGLEQFVRGFAKKVLFADTLAVYVDPVFAHPGAYASPVCWFAVIAYAGQIYYDFSGYSEMAIGVGRMLGFQLPENFRHPYLSLNVTEFWRRWHITLSTWLRDYLYISLGGNRRGRGRTYVNLMITMLLGGLWHGASWNFVVWGGLHGVALAGHKWVAERRRPGSEGRFGAWGKLASWVTTFTFVLVTWVFFRAPSFATAWAYLGKLAFLDAGGMDWYYVQGLVVIGLGAALHVWVKARGERDLRLDLTRAAAWPALAVLLLLVLLYAPFGTNPFIYFQF